MNKNVLSESAQSLQLGNVQNYFVGILPIKLSDAYSTNLSGKNICTLRGLTLDGHRVTLYDGKTGSGFKIVIYQRGFF